MSDTRKVSVTMTRYYSKQVHLEVDVPNEIGEDEVQDWLTENDDLTERVELALDDAILYSDDENWEYSDPENNSGGHL